MTPFTVVVSGILRYYPHIVYSHRNLTIVVNDGCLRMSFTMIVIWRKASYTIGVNDYRRRLPYSVVIHCARSFTTERHLPGYLRAQGCAFIKWHSRTYGYVYILGLECLWVPLYNKTENL